MSSAVVVAPPPVAPAVQQATFFSDYFKGPVYSRADQLVGLVGLPAIDAEVLHDTFCDAFGDVLYVQLLMNHDCAIVCFRNVEHAVACVDVETVVLLGRKVRIQSMPTPGLNLAGQKVKNTAVLVVPPALHFHDLGSSKTKDKNKSSQDTSLNSGKPARASPRNTGPAPSKFNESTPMKVVVGNSKMVNALAAAIVATEERNGASSLKRPTASTSFATERKSVTEDKGFVSSTNLRLDVEKKLCETTQNKGNHESHKTRNRLKETNDEAAQRLTPAPSIKRFRNSASKKNAQKSTVSVPPPAKMRSSVGGKEKPSNSIPARRKEEAKKAQPQRETKAQTKAKKLEASPLRKQGKEHASSPSQPKNKSRNTNTSPRKDVGKKSRDLKTTPEQKRSERSKSRKQIANPDKESRNLRIDVKNKTNRNNQTSETAKEKMNKKASGKLIGKAKPKTITHGNSAKGQARNHASSGSVAVNPAANSLRKVDPKSLNNGKKKAERNTKEYNKNATTEHKSSFSGHASKNIRNSMRTDKKNKGSHLNHTHQAPSKNNKNRSIVKPGKEEVSHNSKRTPQKIRKNEAEQSSATSKTEGRSAGGARSSTITFDESRKTANKRRATKASPQGKSGQNKKKASRAPASVTSMRNVVQSKFGSEGNRARTSSSPEKKVAVRSAHETAAAAAAARRETMVRSKAPTLRKRQQAAHPDQVKKMSPHRTFSSGRESSSSKKFLDSFGKQMNTKPNTQGGMSSPARKRAQHGTPEKKRNKKAPKISAKAVGAIERKGLLIF